jgi:uncharacterized membrane protein YccC
VTGIKEVSTRVRDLLRRHRAQLGLSVRVTVAALVSLALAQYFGLRLPLWAVLTAVIVTQMSVGRSLKATIDYLAGTVGGAIYGGAVAVLIPHSSEIALLAVLALAVAPLAFIAAINPTLAVAPITAVIVLLVPTITHVSPLTSAIDRVIEVALGAITGLAVSFLIFPSSAHGLVIESAARALDQIARALGQLLAGLTKGLDTDALHRIQDGIGYALAQLNIVGTEAERERSARLTVGPDIAPLLRTLLRLRHDLVMIGRAAVVPLPDTLRARLAPPLAHIGTAAVAYLRASSAALVARRDPPSLNAAEEAFDAYAAEVVALRQEGLTRGLPGDVAERFFALGFALEQMRQNFNDLQRCVVECAERRTITQRVTG